MLNLILRLFNSKQNPRVEFTFPDEEKPNPHVEFAFLIADVAPNQNKYLIPNCICRGGAFPVLEILPNVVEPKFPSGG